MDGEVTVKARKTMDWSRWRIILVLADQGRNGVRVSFLWYQNYLDSEATRTTRTMKRGLTIRRIVYWNCSLTQVAAALQQHMRKSAWSHCRAISRWTSCSCPWTPKPKVRVGTLFCYSLDFLCSGFEVGVGHQLQESISFVDYVFAVHQKHLHWNRKVRERISRFSRCCSPTVTSLQRDSQNVRERESPFTAEVNFPKVALLSSNGFGLSMI